MLRAADRYAYTGCGSTADSYLFYLGDELILIHIGKSFSVECRSRTNSWPLSSRTFPLGPCPPGSLSSWLIPAVVYEPVNSRRSAAYSQQTRRRGRGPETYSQESLLDSPTAIYSLC